MTNSTKNPEHVARELQRAKLLATGIRANSPIVTPELDRQNAPTVREGETMIAAAAEQERNARLLDVASDELTETGRQVRDAVAERVYFGEERTMWFSIARGEFFSAKTTVQARGGVKAVYELGLKGALAESPEKMIQQGQHFLQKLANPLSLRAKTDVATIDTEALIQSLTSPFSELEVWHDLFLEADQNVAAALKAKDDAYGRLRLLNQTIAQETYAAWRRAGFKKLALRLRRQLNQVMTPNSSGNTTTPPTGQNDTSTTTSDTTSSGADATSSGAGTTSTPSDPGTVTETPDDTSASSDATA